MRDTASDASMEERGEDEDEELEVTRLVASLSSFLSSFESRELKGEGETLDARRKEVRSLQGVRGSAGNVLHSYQEDGVLWLIDHYLNAVGTIVADEMGLGKTLQSLAFICWLSEVQQTGRPVIVVCPLSVVSSWEAQMRDFIATAPPYIRIHETAADEPQKPRGGAERLRTLTYLGSAEDRHYIREKVANYMIHQSPKASLPRNRAAPFDLLLTTYETLMNDVQFFTMFEWECVFFDEASRLKSKSSKRRNVFLQSLRRRHVVMMTGTPVEKDLEELWSLLQFVQPDVFTSSSALVSAFCSLPPSRREGESGRRKRDAPRMQRIRRNRDILQRLVKAFILRRTLSQVRASWALLPLVELVVFLPLAPLQKRLYFWLLTRESEALEAVDYPAASLQQDSEAPPRNRGLSALVGEDVNRTSGAAKKIVAHMRGLQNLFMQLRKCCNHPALFRLHPSASESAFSFPSFRGGDTAVPSSDAEEGDDAESLLRDSSKIAALEQILSFYLPKREKVVVFSFSTMMLDLVEDFLDEKGIASARLDGRMSDPERREAIAAFAQKPSGAKESSAMVFLVSVRAGGYGLTLSGASSVCVFLEGGGDGNPQIERQAIARLYRQGQKKKVKVIRLITKSTVEEVMYWRGRQKLKLAADVLSEDEGEEDEDDDSSGQAQHAARRAASMRELITCGISSLTALDSEEAREGEVQRETEEATGGKKGRAPEADSKGRRSLASRGDSELLFRGGHATRGRAALDFSHLTQLLADAETASEDAEGLMQAAGEPTRRQGATGTATVPRAEKQGESKLSAEDAAPPSGEEVGEEPEREEDAGLVVDLSGRGRPPAKREEEEPKSASKMQEGESSIYEFEGRDYTDVLKQALSSKQRDLRALQHILLEARREEEERGARQTGDGGGATPRDESDGGRRSVRARRAPLTPAELDALREEAERRRQEARASRWAANSYISRSLQEGDAFVDESDALRRARARDALSPGRSEAEGETDEPTLDRYFHYQEGDASLPKENPPGAIVHFVDTAGTWLEGRGFFRSLDRLSDIPRKYLALAKRMGDLHLGDCHLVPLNAATYVAFCVCLKRHRQRMSLSLPLLRAALQKLHGTAKRLALSLHLPRCIVPLPADIDRNPRSPPHANSSRAVEKLVRALFSRYRMHAFLYHYRGGREGASSGREAPPGARRREREAGAEEEDAPQPKRRERDGRLQQQQRQQQQTSYALTGALAGADLQRRAADATDTAGALPESRHEAGGAGRHAGGERPEGPQPSSTHTGAPSGDLSRAQQEKGMHSGKGAALRPAGDEKVKAGGGTSPGAPLAGGTSNAVCRPPARTQLADANRERNRAKEETAPGPKRERDLPPLACPTGKLQAPAPPSAAATPPPASKRACGRSRATAWNSLRKPAPREAASAAGRSTASSPLHAPEENVPGGVERRSNAATESSCETRDEPREAESASSSDCQAPVQASFSCPSASPAVSAAPSSCASSRHCSASSAPSSSSPSSSVAVVSRSSLLLAPSESYLSLRSPGAASASLSAVSSSPGSDRGPLRDPVEEEQRENEPAVRAAQATAASRSGSEARIERAREDAVAGREEQSASRLQGAPDVAGARQHADGAAAGRGAAGALADDGAETLQPTPEAERASRPSSRLCASGSAGVSPSRHAAPPSPLAPTLSAGSSLLPAGGAVAASAGPSSLGVSSAPGPLPPAPRSGHSSQPRPLRRGPSASAPQRVRLCAARVGARLGSSPGPLQRCGLGGVCFWLHPAIREEVALYYMERIAYLGGTVRRAPAAPSDGTLTEFLSLVASKNEKANLWVTRPAGSAHADTRESCQEGGAREGAESEAPRGPETGSLGDGARGYLILPTRVLEQAALSRAPLASSSHRQPLNPALWAVGVSEALSQDPYISFLHKRGEEERQNPSSAACSVATTRLSWSLPWMPRSRRPSAGDAGDGDGSLQGDGLASRRRPPLDSLSPPHALGLTPQGLGNPSISVEFTDWLEGLLFHKGMIDPGAWRAHQVDVHAPSAADCLPSSLRNLYSVGPLPLSVAVTLSMQHALGVASENKKENLLAERREAFSASLPERPAAPTEMDTARDSEKGICQEPADDRGALNGFMPGEGNDG